MNKICLCMIVKNESKVIKRCLDSVMPIISAYCIVDTGSDDGTKGIIRQHMKGIQGNVIASDWKGFGASRTEAIRYAEKQDCDYLLFIDADDELVIHGDLPELTEDAYYITQRHADITFQRLSLVSTKLPWEYVGVLHEYIHSKEPYKTSTLNQISFLGHPGEGARSTANGNKFEHDAKVLEKALKDEPNNERYVFYLAQSYADCGKAAKAITNYRRRIEMGGWDEETFISYLRIARLMETNGYSEANVIKAYLDAYQCRPTRAESLCSLSRYLRVKEKYNLAVMFAESAILIQIPDDALFVEYGVYEWEALDEYAVSTYWTGQYKESMTACNQLLSNDKLPPHHAERIIANRKFASDKLN